jgi:hypothetical protein
MQCGTRSVSRDPCAILVITTVVVDMDGLNSGTNSYTKLAYFIKLNFNMIFFYFLICYG